MRMSVVSLFPEMIEAVTRHGVVGRACKNGLLTVNAVNPREFASDPHRSVDDRPYGGGPGMVMTYDPLSKAIEAARATQTAGSPVVLLTPQGERFDQARAARYATLEGLVMVAGRYEGIDERVVETMVDEEVSLGDFVLSGGEIAAMAVVDAVARLLPGVLGDSESAAQDSFGDGLLDHPHYTRPERVAERDVPSVLLSGDHERIGRWRLMQALGRTRERRPDLLEQRGLTEDELKLLEEYMSQGGR
ncbi:MAG: tRNA (guanosine(37)-N1)-methyltransferase TrmD [Pseudomonadota bacterium]